MTTNHERFVKEMAYLTQPINGQLPRPWMTDLTNPLSANVFIVGKNQAKGYNANGLAHARHLDALFNRSEQSCRGLYDEMTGNSTSPTRRNIDHFRSILKREGVIRILETNVVCYSTPMSADLRLTQHRGGSVRGTDIFRTLLGFVSPKVLVAHGAGTRETLNALLGSSLPAPIEVLSEPQGVQVAGMTVFVIPSLAPPKWNQWSGWADAYLTKVAQVVARVL